MDDNAGLALQEAQDFYMSEYGVDPSANTSEGTWGVWVLFFVLAIILYWVTHSQNKAPD